MIVAVPALFMPVLIIGGILGGVFTATEAGALAVPYALLLAVGVYRELGWRDLPGVLAATLKDTAAIFVIIAVAGIFGYVITVLGVGVTLIDFVTGLTKSPWVVLLLRHRRTSTALNLGWTHRASAATSLVAAGALARRRFGLAAFAVAVFVGLNRSFHGFLLRRFGVSRAVAGAGLHVLHHLVGIAAVPAGVIAFLARGRRRAPSRRR